MSLRRAPSTPRNAVACPICSLSFPSSLIQQHAAACGLEPVADAEDRGRQEKQDDEDDETTVVEVRPPSKRRRSEDETAQPQPGSGSKRAKKPTARQRTAQGRQREDEKKYEEEDNALQDAEEEKTRSTRDSKDSMRSLLRSAHNDRVQRQRERAATISTFPPSSPVMQTTTITTSTSTVRLKITIPSPSPPSSRQLGPRGLFLCLSARAVLLLSAWGHLLLTSLLLPMVRIRLPRHTTLCAQHERPHAIAAHGVVVLVAVVSLLRCILLLLVRYHCPFPSPLSYRQ